MKYFVLHSFEAPVSVVYPLNLGSLMDEVVLYVLCIRIMYMYYVYVLCVCIICHKDVNVNRNVNRKSRQNSTSTESTWFRNESACFIIYSTIVYFKLLITCQ